MGRHANGRSPFALARYAAGFTQAEFAEVSGLSHPTVVKIEKRPWESSWTSLKKYIMALPDSSQRDELANWANEVMRRKNERENARHMQELAHAVEKEQG